MDLFTAVRAIIYLLENSAPFGGSHALYSVVGFVPEFPLGDVETPKVAFSIAGGTNTGKEIGYANRDRMPRQQMDVLADDPVSAQRIFQNVREAVLQDLNHSGSGNAGDPGVGYLHAQGIRTVRIGEPQSQPWDDEGRVSRLVADVDIRFLDA